MAPSCLAWAVGCGLSSSRTFAVAILDFDSVPELALVRSAIEGDGAQTWADGSKPDEELSYTWCRMAGLAADCESVHSVRVVKAKQKGCLVERESR